MAEKTRRPSTPRQEVLDRERNETYKTETNVDCPVSHGQLFRGPDATPLFLHLE